MRLGTRTTPGSFAEVTCADGLRAIARPEKNLVCWRRALPSELELDARRAMGMPAQGPLADDLAKLGDLFRRLTGAVRLKTSLALVTTDKCRKLHIDYKTLRLVCTYLGPGTEWVADEDVDRSALGQDDACIDEANARIVRHGSKIQRARAGDVVVMKGQLETPHGVVHRSPPIVATGERRLVLTIDVASAETPEANGG